MHTNKVFVIVFTEQFHLMQSLFCKKIIRCYSTRIIRHPCSLVSFFFWNFNHRSFFGSTR